MNFFDCSFPHHSDFIFLVSASPFANRCPHGHARFGEIHQMDHVSDLAFGTNSL